jgi:serine/threonine-protein kinase
MLQARSHFQIFSAIYNPATPVSLGPGIRLGSYEVSVSLGAGGMGEVYRARDTKLNRDVALKILPDVFAADPDRLARFKREAHVLASLNHPNIAAIYGFEDSGSTHALVLELVEGPTLADRIAKGPIPPDDAVPIARQIAEALEAAHEHGIIHRDLKPANIKVRDDGTVKVLDFGLAKAMEPMSAMSPSLTNSPTITTPAQMTGVGTLLGTAAYMSPEQAKGRPTDKRSDVWAFGCVLFEMLTGTRAFDGEDVADTLASVLKGGVDWSALPVDVPPAVVTLLKRCLERDRHQRIGDIAAAKFVLREPAVGTPTRVATVADRTPLPLWRRALPIVLTATAVGALGLVLGRGLQPAAAPARVTRFTYSLPADQRFTEVGGQVIAISPDGSHIAYVANGRIYQKPLSEQDARPVPGTDANISNNERIGNVMFSPDGLSIGFFQGSFGGGSVKKVPHGGGAAVGLGQVPITSGLLSTVWRNDGLIVADPRDGIVRITSDNRHDVLLKRTEVVTPPQVLPDGDTLVYAVVPGLWDVTGAPSAAWDNAKIVSHSLKSGAEKTLIDGGGAPLYVPTGHLLYVVGGTMFAVPFDARAHEVKGGPVPVVEGIGRPVSTNGAAPTVYYAVSENGTLIYVPGPVSPFGGQFGLALATADGHAVPLKLRPGSYLFPRVSPDERHVAFGTDDASGTNVWVYDISGASAPRQLTVGGKNRNPVWNNNGTLIAFESDREGDLGMYVQRADGTAPPTRLTKAASGSAQIPESWSPDGQTLLYGESKDGQFELWTLSLSDKRSSRFSDVRSVADPTSAMFSPDGKWVVYLATDKSFGRTVYVESVPPNGVKHPIAAGAWHPTWSADGKRLFYRMANGREFVVSVTTQPSFSVSNPELLGSEPFQSRGRVEREYEVMRDGRFLGIVAVGQRQDGAVEIRASSASVFGTAAQINVVLNWFEELKQRVPSN